MESNNSLLNLLNFFQIRSFTSFNEVNVYAFPIILFTLFVMLALFMKSKIKLFLNNRNRLIKLAEDYERKRKARGDLKVILLCFKRFIYSFNFKL